jgi:hypothetical protein
LVFVIAQLFRMVTLRCVGAVNGHLRRARLTGRILRLRNSLQCCQ